MKMVCKFCNDLRNIRYIHTLVDKTGLAKWVDQIAIETVTKTTSGNEGYCMNRGRYTINYCPMCGEQVKGGDKE